MESWMLTASDSNHFVTVVLFVVAIAPFSASVTNSATVLLAEFFLFILCK